MAKQIAKSGLAAKLGPQGQKALDTHKNDETVYSAGGNLPAGIEGAIAELVDVKFGIYKEGKHKGEYFFMAQGVVREPKTVRVDDGFSVSADGREVPIEGLRTSIGPEALCDTPEKTGEKSRKTLDQHLQWTLNELRKLGLGTAELSDVANLEASAQALKEAGVMFRFRTWKGAKQTTGPYANREPTVQHQWLGATEHSSEDAALDGSGDVEDNSGEASDDEGTPFDPAETVDLTALGEAADGGDADAASQLNDLASAQSIDANEYATWAEVAELLSGAGEGEGETESTEELPEPEPKEVYYYKPPKASKGIECEVTAKFAKSKTVNLKNLDDNKRMYKSIAWSDLKDKP